MRVQLEKTFEAMGGQNLDKDSSDMLNDLQSQLSRVLDELSAMYSKSLDLPLQKCCGEVSKLLQNVRGGSQQQNSQKQIQGEADLVITPLIDVLHNILSQFAKLCDKTVLKRLLKELWKLVINNLEKIVILPPIDNRGLLNLPGSFVVCFCCRGFFFLLVGIKNYTFCLVIDVFIEFLRMLYGMFF